MPTQILANGHTVATLKELVDERDRRYTEKFDAQEKSAATGLAYQKEAVSAAFAASEKAIVKAEAAQTAYNARSNEFRATLDDQNKTMLPRTEADQRFAALRELIDKNGDQVQALMRGESRIVGVNETAERAKQQNKWIVGLVVTIVGLLITTVTALGSLALVLFGKH